MTWHEIQTASTNITFTEWNNMVKDILHNNSSASVYINDDETYVGAGAGANITAGSGINNTLIGHDAGNDITTGDNNTLIGFEAMDAEADIDNCVFVGYQAGKANTQNNIVGIGYQALDNNSGETNTAVGYGAMDAANTGGANTAVGSNALGANTSGNTNTAIGDRAMAANTVGFGNSTLGYLSGTAITNGDYNTLIGTQCGDSITEGRSNVAMGRLALATTTTGTTNTAVGAQAGQTATNTISGCVYLGYDAGSDNTTANTLWINNSNSAYPLLQGDFANDTVRFGDNAAAWNVQFVNSTLHLKERAEATAIADYGCIWTESDNTLHFKDGAGTEYTIDLTPV